jgi:carboxymethylenebutenolidase
VPTTDVALGRLHTPEGGTGDVTWPGVVFIHDVWGLSDHYRAIAGRFAAAGFGALAVDLYRREGEVAISDPGAWIRDLSDPQVVSDIGDAADLIRARLGDSAKVGVVGFCMGGTYALLSGCEAGARVDAVVPFYGLLSHAHGLLHDPSGLDRAKKPIEPLEAAERLQCPLLGFFGAEDDFVPVADVQALESAVAASGAEAEVVLVAGAGHAFMNDTRADAHRAEAAAVAWERTVDFLGRCLA